MLNLNQSIERMTDRLSVILDQNIHSIWLYGSAVLDDFRLGWSDIDLLVLTCGRITEEQARQLVGLRQNMLETEPDNPYYRELYPTDR
jgi:predicted nucleotidyltransferase